MGKPKITTISALERKRCQVPGCHKIAYLKLITPKVKRNNLIIDLICMECAKVYLKMCRGFDIFDYEQ